MQPESLTLFLTEVAEPNNAEKTAGITVVNGNFDPGNVRRYGATGDGVTDDTQAFTNALAANDCAYVPDGTYLINNVVVPLRKQLCGNGTSTVLKKNANGPILDMRELSTLQDLRLDGDGANYTGPGIQINTGDNTIIMEENGFQTVERVEISDTESYCVDYDTPNRGTQSQLVSCRFSTHNNVAAAVRWPDEPATFGNRIITRCFALSTDLVDVNAADNGDITMCTIAGGSGGIIFPSGTTNPATKLRIIGNRLASKLTVRGANHVILGNVCGEDIELASGAVNNILGANNFASGKNYIDNSGAANTFLIDAAGNLNVTGNWTFSGNAEFDANIVIDSQLRTSQTGSNTATPSGATSRQWPIYDESGTLLGYVPIYASPWT